MNVEKKTMVHGGSRRHILLLLCVGCSIAIVGVTWGAVVGSPRNLEADASAFDVRLPDVGLTELSSPIALGRLHLIAGNFSRAQQILSTVTPHSPADNQLRSFGLWIANQQLGKAHDAATWRGIFAEQSVGYAENDRIFFQFATNHNGVVREPIELASLGTVPALQSSDTNDLTQAVRHLSNARQSYGESNTIENRIRLASWLLLFGEIAADERRGGLVTRAVDLMTEGFEHFDSIESEIQKDPSLEERISKDTAIAIRLDVARVRRTAFQKKLTLARDQETERLAQLRELVKAYRDLTQQLAMVHAEYLIEDYDSAKQLSAAALADADQLRLVVERRRDYFLFSDEPQPLPESDFNAAITAPEPFSSSVIAHLKGIQSLIAYRLAVKSPSSIDEKLIAEAESWALASLGTPGGNAPADVPPGQDENCITARYALALIKEARGTILSAKAPFSTEGRTAAKSEFAVSQDQLKALQVLLKEKQTKTAKAKSEDRRLAFVDQEVRPQETANDAVAMVAFADNATPPLTALSSDIDRRADLLANPSAYLRLAEAATMAGKTNEAWLSLSEGIRRHSDVSLIVSWIDAGRRNEIDAKELTGLLDDAITSAIIKNDDHRVQLVRAKVVLKGAWKLIAKTGLGNLDETARGSLDAEIKTQEVALRSALSLPGNLDPETRAELQSYLALAISYRASTSRDSEVTASAQEAYRLAQNAAAAEELALVKATGLRSVELREALVAARLAIGHLAIVSLPNYRDESLIAFAAAFDESAKLPIPAADIKSLGSPMWNAIMNRPENSAAKLALEERQQRLFVTKFLEAAFTVKFGAAAEASDQMKVALASVPQDNVDGSSGSSEAASLLASADGFEAKTALRDSVRAFHVLTDVSAGRPKSALVEACRLLIPAHPSTSNDDEYLASLNEAAFAQAIRRIQSPLVGYAFASALESYADSLPGVLHARRPELMRNASNAYAATASLLESPAERARYSQLVSLTETSQLRLAQPEAFLTAGKTLRQKGDLSGAAAEYEKGVKCHSQNQQLWQALLETRLSGVQSAATKDAAAYDDILALLAEADESRLVSSTLTNYYRGLIYRRQGKFADAADVLSLGRSAADNPQQRVQIISELAAVRLQMTPVTP